MHFITIFLASFLLYNLVTSFTIISSNRVFNDFDDDEFAFAVSDTKSVLQSMYVSQEVGKSHRFFFTVGEREDNDVLLDHVLKQTGWKNISNVQVNVTYPPDNKQIKKLTFVSMMVYQGSPDNRINVIDGGIGKASITFAIHANQTKYVAYKAEFYGYAA